MFPSVFLTSGMTIPLPKAEGTIPHDTSILNSKDNNTIKTG